MRAAEQTELIVLALRDHAAMVEEDAKAFLAEHDAGVRADALAEGAALLRRQAARKIGRPVHNSGLRTGAILLERAADRPATGTELDFFQPGHTYTRQINGERAEFEVRNLDTHPNHGGPVAFGWYRRQPRTTWHPYSQADLDGWADVTDEVTP